MFYQYTQLERGDAIVVGCDTSYGAGDYCVAQFLMRPKTAVDIPRQVLVYRDKVSAPIMTDALVPELERIYDTTGVKPIIAYERSNGGAFEIDRVAKLNRQHKYEIFAMPDPSRVEDSEPTRLGWDTNSVSRPAMLADLKDLIDRRAIGVWDESTISELLSFVRVKTTSTVKAQAEAGAHDDCVMALAIAWQLHKLSRMPASDAQRARVAAINARAIAGRL